MKRRPLVRIALAALAALASATGSTARADDKADCLAAAANGQTLDDAHKIVEARDQFRICARAQCPSVVQTSCIEWLEGAERSLPTVVLSARNAAGADLVDVSVSVDGVAFSRKLDGRALPLDPGPHSFRFELADGTTAVSQAIVKEGEKDQPIGAVLVPVASVPQVHEPPLRGGMPARAVAGLAVGGAGVVLVGVGAYFGARALSKNSDSGPYCDVGGVKDDCYGQGVALRNEAVGDATASTVLVSVGVAAIAGGVVLWLTSPSASGSAATLGFDGRTLHLGGSF